MMGAAHDDYTRWYRQDSGRVLQAETYEKGYHHHRRIRMVCSLLGRLGVRRILDMGCGDGWQVERLARAGFEVFGCDIAPERLKRAKSQAPGALGLFVGDLRMPPLPPGRLECIYLGQVIEHLPEPSEILKSLWTALRPGGFLVLDTPCRDNLVDDVLRWSGLAARFPAALDWGIQLDPGHLHFMTLREIHNLLRGAGFEFLVSRGAPRMRWNTPRIGNPLAARRRLWKVHDFVEQILGWLPRYRGTGAIVVCVARRPAGSAASTGETHPGVTSVRGGS